MSTQKKNTRKGFTLVEVIVVAVIVAILAAVAIPIYQQYVTDSRANSTSNAGGSIASFMGACVASAGTASPIAATTGPNTITCTRTAGNVTIAIPPEIQITISSATASGTVTAVHTKCATAADCTKTFNY